MIVISDTTPIISLLKIGKLDILKDLFNEVGIPAAVFSELASNSRFSDEIEDVRKSPFIRISQVRDKNAVDIFQRATGLDLGESEAIVLSKELNAGMILMDEKRGRSVARQMDIKLMGTVGIILTAYKKNLISSEDVRNYARILKESKRFISDRLLEFLISETSK